ncbi:MAG TPA: cytochrome b/b6 domain-containing protein, partial [Candidatus Deferrimicrobium sp.]
AIGVYHTYIFFALGKHRIAMPGLFDFSEVGPVLKYYLHLSREKPNVEKYNVLQKYGYFLLFAVSVLQTLLGFALYPYFLPGVFSFMFAIFGDAVQIRIWHTTIMWLFISFTAVHVYLVVTEDRRMVKAMIDGYYYRNTPGGATEG